MTLLHGACESCSRSCQLYIGYWRILLETESESSVNRLYLVNLLTVDHHKSLFVGPLLSLDYVDKKNYARDSIERLNCQKVKSPE